ncbi:MAG: hypothetical protein LBD06_05630, partial [Candidatus Accumulibacter sp.]|nr:hypothetical protein [Accumulibacter sp.]
MSIAIISVLPKSAPSTAASVAGGADNENPEQDFTSLLFGRLNAAQLDAGSILSVVSESTARGFGHRSADDDADADAGADYPLDFLAALAQAPLERRADVALAEGEASAHPLPGAAQEPFTDDHAPAAGRATQDIFETKFTVANEPATNDPVASGLATNDPVASGLAASEPAASGSVTNGSAAKFAASPEIAPGKKSASLQEFAGLPTLSTVTAGAQARADEAPPTLPVPTS